MIASSSVNLDTNVLSTPIAIVQKRQDHGVVSEILLYVLLLFCIGIAVYNGSWTPVLIVGTTVLITFMLIKTLSAEFLGYGASLCLGVLSSLAAFQMKDNPHFILVFFVSAFSLVFNNQWKTLIPVCIVFVIHQVAFYVVITRKAEVPADMTMTVVYTIFFLLQSILSVILLYRLSRLLVTKQTLEEKYSAQTTSLQLNIAYAKQIASGNFESIAQVSQDDVLGYSLSEMSKNIKASAEENRNRNWTMAGIAKIAEIMRVSNHKMEDLSNQIVSYLVKYLNATQGGIFVINDSDLEHKYLELKGCYAYDRKKFLEKKIEFGEGLLGQSVLERSTMYLKVVPQDYFQITSGLGQANPKTLIIVPLKTEDDVVGALEIASFNDFADYQRDFLEKVSENIASSIVFAKNQDRTTKLLEDSQGLTEQLRAQEEEMRQSMEELQATQEDVQRKNSDMEEAQAELTKERYLMENLMKYANEMIYFKDLKSRFIRMSNNMAVAFKVKDPKDVIGKSDFDFFTDEHARPAYEAEQEIIRTGKPIIDLLEKETWEDGRETYVSTSKQPLHDLNGKVVGTFGISRDVTKITKDELEVQRKENTYNVLLKYSTEIYFITDSNGKIIFHSPSYFRILEREETNLLGTVLMSLVNKEDMDSLQKSFQEVKKDAGKTLDVDFRFAKSDGQEVRMHGVLLNNSDEGSIKGIVLIAQEAAGS